MMVFGFLMLLIFTGRMITIALVVGGVLLSNNSPLPGIFRPGKEKTAIELLEERYVRGEIDRKEFEKMRAEIGG